MAATSLLGAAPKVIVAHALSLHGAPKYPAGFDHFDYVNPDAPKGGTLRQWVMGTYDNFNQFALRGPGRGGKRLPVRHAHDGIRGRDLGVLRLDRARRSNTRTTSRGSFSTSTRKRRRRTDRRSPSDDVVFSFNKFLNEGVPQFKEYYAGVAKVEALDKLRVKFTLKKGDKAMMINLSQLNVLPKKYWESRKFGEPSTDVPLGTGAYTVKDYKIGQYVVWQRSPTYWALNLPVNRGQLNFDLLRYDYYRDETVAFEAFKAGEFDLYQESVAKNWATMYKGKNFDNGAIIKEDIPHEIPQGMQAMVFNIQRPIFKDREGAPGPELRHGLRMDEQEPVLQPVHAAAQLLHQHALCGNGTARARGAEDPHSAQGEDPRRGLHHGVQSSRHRRVPVRSASRSARRSPC